MTRRHLDRSTGFWSERRSSAWLAELAFAPLRTKRHTLWARLRGRARKAAIAPWRADGLDVHGLGRRRGRAVPEHIKCGADRGRRRNLVDDLGREVRGRRGRLVAAGRGGRLLARGAALLVARDRDQRLGRGGLLAPAGALQPVRARRTRRGLNFGGCGFERATHQPIRVSACCSVSAERSSVIKASRPSRSFASSLRRSALASSLSWSTKCLCRCLRRGVVGG